MGDDVDLTDDVEAELVAEAGAGDGRHRRIETEAVLEGLGRGLHPAQGDELSAARVKAPGDSTR